MCMRVHRVRVCVSVCGSECLHECRESGCERVWPCCAWVWSGHTCGCVREPLSPFSLLAAPQGDVPVDTELQEAKGPEGPGLGHTGSASRTTLTHEWGMRGRDREVPEQGQIPELLGHNPQPKTINVTESPGRQHWDQGTGDTRLGSGVPGSHFPQGPKSSLTLCLMVLSGAGCLGT